MNIEPVLSHFLHFVPLFVKKSFRHFEIFRFRRFPFGFLFVRGEVGGCRSPPIVADFADFADFPDLADFGGLNLEQFSQLALAGHA